MRRALVLLVPLALLLTAAALVGATAAQTAPDGQSPLVSVHGNATNYLTMAPPAVESTGHATVGLDVGLAVSTDGRNLQTTHELRSFRQRFAAAETDENRTAAYEATITSIEERTDELRARSVGLISSYAQRSVTAETLVRERAAISAEAASLQQVVDELNLVARQRLGYDLPDEHGARLENVDGRLAILQGSIADRTARLAASGSSHQVVYVESSTSGATFALMEGDTYVRETYLGDEYDPSAPDQFADGDGNPIERVLQRATQLYPTTNSEGVSAVGTTGVYQYNAMFEGGLVSVYIDGATTNAFRESLQADAPSFPPSERAETRSGAVTLQVNRTFSTGPMEIELVDSTTGTGLDGSVTVDGQPVGNTGLDGRLWAVEPRGEVTVEASTPEENLTLVLEA